MNVADLAKDKLDLAGVPVDLIYYRHAPIYAIYGTAQRVGVHYADDPAIADEQRKVLSQLAPVRGEINGLVDGWRTADEKKRIFIWFGWKRGLKLRARAKRYDRQVADALVVALEGDLTGADALLNKIRDDAKGERVSWARFEYLLMAIGAALLLTIIAIVVAWLDKPERCIFGRMLCFKEAWDLWRGIAAGAFGAFFSIALAIRGRTILTDLYRTSNLMDAALRVVIGAIAGAMLVGLIDAKFVRFWLGESSPDEYGALHILIVGFIAGFSERLVPDLLAKADVRTGEAPIIRKPEPNLETDRKGALPGAAGGGAGGGEGEDSDDSLSTDPVPEQSGEDACAADIELPDDEATRDAELPPASGGVERSEGAGQ
jgi:hypothetical protein